MTSKRNQVRELKRQQADADGQTFSDIVDSNQQFEVDSYNEHEEA